MEPLVAYGYLLITTAALDGIFVGTVGGALAWVGKGRRLWILLLVALAYLVTVLRADYSPKAGVVFGLPLLVLTFLISWLAASCIQAGTTLKWFWVAPLAACCSLVVAIAWMFLMRIDLRVPATAAAVADLLLIAVLLLRARSRAAPAE